MTWNIDSILSKLESDYKILGDSKMIKNIASLDDATINDLTFCNFDGNLAKEKIVNSNAGIILCKKTMDNFVKPKSNQQLVFLDNPKLVFIQFTNKKFLQTFDPKISDSVKISDNTKIGKNCFIGEYVTIDKNSIIGDNSIIFSGVHISDSSIGKNCVIQPGSIIGMDGFSYERLPDNSLEKFPHFKKVIIGNNVDISSNCSIARGALTNTIINDGTKLDALVHIAHNVNVGKNCLLTAGTIIAGSSQIGDNCWMGPNCTILDYIIIGNNVIVGAGSTVTKNISNNQVVVGTPAKPIKTNLSEIDLFRLCARK